MGPKKKALRESKSATLTSLLNVNCVKSLINVHVKGLKLNNKARPFLADAIDRESVCT